VAPLYVATALVESLVLDGILDHTGYVLGLQILGNVATVSQGGKRCRVIDNGTRGRGWIP
jgi:hypothetical protein